jgi:hypothetical protein
MNVNKLIVANQDGEQFYWQNLSGAEIVYLDDDRTMKIIVETKTTANLVKAYYDDICRQCGKEQTVSIYALEQQTWDCHYCEWTNPVAEA